MNQKSTPKKTATKVTAAAKATGTKVKAPSTPKR